MSDDWLAEKQIRLSEYADSIRPKNLFAPIAAQYAIYFILVVVACVGIYGFNIHWAPMLVGVAVITPVLEAPFKAKENRNTELEHEFHEKVRAFAAKLDEEYADRRTIAERHAEQNRRKAEQDALEQEVEEEQAAEQLAASIKIIKEAVRPIAQGKDNSTMLSLIDEELAKIAADEGICTALSTNHDASDTLRMCHRLLHEKGEADPFIEKYFIKLLPDLERSGLQIVKNS